MGERRSQPNQPGQADEQTKASGGGAAQPHDSLFRFVFGKPMHAASELRAVLPAPLADRLDLANLRRVNGSFVDEQLTNRHFDVLMRTRLDGREAFVRPPTWPASSCRGSGSCSMTSRSWTRQRCGPGRSPRRSG